MQPQLIHAMKPTWWTCNNNRGLYTTLAPTAQIYMAAYAAPSQDSQQQLRTTNYPIPKTHNTASPRC